LICDHIHRYPVIPPNGVVSEVYHAQKWRQGTDQHTLSPMYDAGDRHYYVGELARLKDGGLIIPVRWLEDVDNGIWADAYQVVLDDQVRVREYFTALRFLIECFSVDRRCQR
jgi:hypothetical protein